MQTISERVARLKSVGGEETSTRGDGIRGSAASSRQRAVRGEVVTTRIRGAHASTSILAKSVFEADAEASPTDARPDVTSLYASLHHTAVTQGLSEEVVLRILKIHAYQTDFMRRVRAGDAFELFFEEAKGARHGIGELLATAIASSGETHRFYRFRTADGMVDYYDIDATPRASS